MHKWTVNLEDWTKANISVLEIIYKEAKQNHNSTTEQAIRISNRSFTIASILITVILIFIGLLCNYLFKPPESSYYIPFDWMIIILTNTVIVILCLGVLIWIIHPKRFMQVGREPKHLMLPEFIQPGNLTESEQKKALLIGEIEELQRKIDFNNKTNRVRLRCFSVVLWVIYFMLLSGSSLLFIYFFQST